MQLRSVLRCVLTVSTVAVVTLLLPIAVLRIVAHDDLWALVILNTMTPYLYLPAYLAFGVALALRRQRLAGLAALVVLAHLGWTFGPCLRAERFTPEPGAPKAFRLFSTNVMAWQSETSAIVQEILGSDADVVAVQELSPIWADAFDSPDFVRAYPHRIVEAHPDASGTGIYSRAPLVDADILSTPSMPVARATVTIDGRPVRLYSVHVLPPSRWEWVPSWTYGLGAIQNAARAETLPVILAGDFNATQHSAWYARFRSDGFRSTHDACGRSLATTWPNGVLPLPAIRLDHVLLSPDVTCVAVTEGVGTGSDHRPVISDLRAARRK